MGKGRLGFEEAFAGQQWSLVFLELDNKIRHM